MDIAKVIADKLGVNKNVVEKCSNTKTWYLVAAYEVDKTPVHYMADLIDAVNELGLRIQYDGCLFYEIYSNDLNKTFKLGMKLAELEDKHDYKDPNFK